MKLPTGNFPFYFRFCIGLLLLILLIVLLVIGKELLVPLTIAVFLTFILLPVSQRLEKLHFPRSLAVIISILIALFVLAVFCWFLYKQIQSFNDDAGQLKQKLLQKMNLVQLFIRKNFNVTVHDQSEWIDKKISDTLNEGDHYLMAIFAITGTFLTNLALIPLYTYFITIYRQKIKKVITLKANGNHVRTLNILQAISHIVQKYLKGLTIDILIIAVLCSIGFLVLGVKHAILFGMLVALCNAIVPYMGLSIASIFPFVMTLITHEEIGYALGAAGICFLVQFIDNHFINPYVVGLSVSINPLAAFVALVASAMIWGIFGMLLCIPITGMIKVVCDNVEVLKPYGFMIGKEKVFGEKLKNRKKEKSN